MKFPKWRPDAPDYDDGDLTGLVACRNVYPAAGGYKPFRDLAAATGTLPAAWVGGAAFENNGNNVFLGATATNLYRHASSVWTSVIAQASGSPWFFVQFGDLAIGVNGTNVIKYTMATGLAAALAGTPPATSTMAAVVRGFVLMAGVAANANRVYWSGLENAEGWTIGTNQCDIQDIPDGGPITGLSGGEYGAVFQESAINIMEYVGTPDIFTFRKVEDSVGCIAHGSIARDGQMHFFLSRKGFKAWSPQTGVLHIGENAVDATFATAYSPIQIRSSIRCTADPDRRLIIWSMPDALWIYNIEQDSWSQVVVSQMVGLVPAYSGAAATLEAVAVTYPSLEDVTPSLDDTFWNSAGAKLLYIMKSDGIGYTFSSGANLEATLKTQKFEPNPGRISHVRTARLVSDCTSQTLNIDVSNNFGAAQSRITSTDLRPNGEISIRASGRIHQHEWVLAQGSTWNYVKGFDYEAERGGRS